MTEEVFKEAVKLNGRVEDLKIAKREIGSYDSSKYKIAYLKRDSIAPYKWEILPEWKMRCIEDILQRHDLMIREEIEKEINSIKQKIEDL